MTSPKRLLVLEDDAYYVTLLQQRISKEWPECVLVHVSGEKDYVGALNEGDFDAILSDYLMPDFSGLKALSIAREECPEIPFLFVSGAINDEVAVESLKAGAVDYVLKDRSARLVPAINRALDLAEANSRRVEHEVLVNSVDGIVWQADQSSLRFTFVSQQAERILGYPVKSWLCKSDFWQNHIHPEDREMAVNLCRHLTLEQNHPDFEYRMLAANDRIVWLRDMVSVCIKKNRTPQIQGIMVDITENKLAAGRISDIQSKLEESNKDLLRRNQEIQSFYHTLSHELKTPLTSAREFVSMAMEGLAGPLNKTQLEYLGIAKESCDQLKVCINDLLDTTRLETGKLALEFKSLDLAELIQRVVMTMKSRAVDHDITLTFESQPKLPLITMDEHRVTQIVTNLLDNAFKFTPPSGQISVELGEAFGRPNFLQVSIRDTGRGIPKENQDRIFDRLYQVKAGDATTEHGIGLGLYLCQELVWLHGGGIWVESELGKGSVFTFVLPKSQKTVQGDVLIIDDDNDILETMRLALAEEYDVRTAVDGLEGLKEMRRKLPDIIILDLAMPNMDGLETLKTVRKNWDSIPIIIHTAYTSGDLMKKAMEYSPFTLLSKPSPIRRMLQTVRRVLRSADTAIWMPNQWEMQNEIAMEQGETFLLKQS